ncbi:MAG: hypothetical protein QG608_1411 [Actinomycetota bacterium]|nr:hypothetical protein [Actinomycetota bacterium]
MTTADFTAGTVPLGYRGEFKWRWAATTLHMFVAVVETPRATADVVREATVDLAAHARQLKGGMKALQSTRVVVPIVVAASVDPEARALVEKVQYKEAGAAPFPVIDCVGTGQVHACTDRLVWGAVFASWLRARVAASVGTPQGATW